MLNLVNVRIRREDGLECTIINQEAGKYQVDNGSKITFKAFETGYYVAIDSVVQQQINAEIERIKLEEEAKQLRIQKAQIESADAFKRAEFLGQFHTKYNAKHLRKDICLTYEEVENLFNFAIKNRGKGINRVDKHNYVVIISSLDKKTGGKFDYHDYWDTDGNYIYSGEGGDDDHQMTKGNLDIYNTNNNGMPIYLFVKLSSTEYYYQGQMKYVSHEFVEEKCKNTKGKHKNIYFKLQRLFDTNGNILYPEFLKGFH